MKTVLVIYTNKRIDSKKEIAKSKRYSFNTESVLTEGDMIESKDYETKMQIVKVMEESFKYYNMSTGELSNTYNSTAQREIRTLAIREEEEDIVYGKIVKE